MEDKEVVADMVMVWQYENGFSAFSYCWARHLLSVMIGLIDDRYVYPWDTTESWY